ncbi:Hypothetical protein NGAL_HAMBI2605_56600 [Neorhizobium galegae bv. orientalis]|nr:Hypothetical protein NGAL_HAMBI2605_56600 [Neorhizobium galegae bv. orientalis]
MDKPDLSDYEKFRAEQHEELCRATASMGFLGSGFCYLRACRRRRVCSGPMLPSVHQIWKVRAQQEIGLSGKACADLPLCIANREPKYYDLFKHAMQELQQMEIDEPNVDLLRTCIWAAARRRSK